MYPLLVVLAILASPSYWWFKIEDRCYVRTPRFPESHLYKIPCVFLEDPTIPKKVIDDYLEKCDQDETCIVILT